MTKGLFKNISRIFALLLPLTLAVVLMSGCQTTKTAVKKSPSRATLETVGAEEYKVNNLLKTAFSQVGNPYRYGGMKPETGFDCSGFVKWVYTQYGVDLPRNSRSMMTAGTPVAREDLRPGDLVFFNYGYSHVGIYTGNGKYIHSPRTGKTVQEDSLHENGRGNRYVTARRIINNHGVDTISDSLKNTWVAEARTQYPRAKMAGVKTKKDTAKLASKKSTKKLSAKKDISSKTAKKSIIAKGKKHKVNQGDTISDLAKRYGVSQKDLIQANNLGKNKNKLKLGQTLVVPSKTKKN